MVAISSWFLIHNPDENKLISHEIQTYQMDSEHSREAMSNDLTNRSDVQLIEVPAPRAMNDHHVLRLLQTGQDSGRVSAVSGSGDDPSLPVLAMDNKTELQISAADIMSVDVSEEGALAKRFRVETPDGHTYMVLNLSEDGSESCNFTLDDLTTTFGTTERKDDITQAWFTSRIDKNAAASKGQRWKQGQWSKDEVDVLQTNINTYCKLQNISDPTEVIFEMSKDERKDFYRVVAKGLQRPLFSVYRRVVRMYDQKNHIGKYSREETQQLRELKKRFGSDWSAIGTAIGRSASSVKDKSRLMRERCNSGKWLPDEERRLTEVVHHLTRTKPGDDVTTGISWLAVAERVGTRSEKQCRTKWLNYLNWKQKGGSEWSREDYMKLVEKLIELDVNEEAEVDWVELAKDWESVRSPQWLRGKWWTLKKHVLDYNMKSFREILVLLKHWQLAVLQNLEVQRANVRLRMSIEREQGTSQLEQYDVTQMNDEGEDEMSDDECTMEADHSYDGLGEALASARTGPYLVPKSDPVTQQVTLSSTQLGSQLGSQLGTQHVIVTHALSGQQIGENVCGVELPGQVLLNDSPDVLHYIISPHGLTNQSAGDIDLSARLTNQEQLVSSLTNHGDGDVMVEEIVDDSKCGVTYVIKERLLNHEIHVNECSEALSTIIDNGVLIQQSRLLTQGDSRLQIQGDSRLQTQGDSRHLTPGDSRLLTPGEHQIEVHLSSSPQTVDHNSESMVMTQRGVGQSETLLRDSQSKILTLASQSEMMENDAIRKSGSNSYVEPVNKIVNDDDDDEEEDEEDDRNSADEEDGAEEMDMEGFVVDAVLDHNSRSTLQYSHLSSVQRTGPMIHLSSRSDPMLPRESTDLTASSSDVESEKPTSYD